MFFLIYVSSATRLFSDEELVDLLEKARRNNESLGITGMLLYKDGNFMQMLEGPRENVLALMEKIKNDPRHSGVLVMIQEETTKREFDDWAMGFRKIGGEEEMANVPGYTDFLDVPLTDERFLEKPSRSLMLLRNFKTMMR